MKIGKGDHQSRVKTKHGKVKGFSPNIKIGRKQGSMTESVGDAVKPPRHQPNRKDSELTQNPTTPTPGPVLMYDNG
jgi:hypothetical protein